MLKRVGLVMPLLIASLAYAECDHCSGPVDEVSVPTTQPAKSQLPAKPGLIVSGDWPMSVIGREPSVAATLRGASGDQAVTKVLTPYPGRASSTLVNVTYGDLPIIISAPHDGTIQPSGVPARTGVGVSQFETARDTNTRLVAEKLAVAIEQELGKKPYVVIARFGRAYIDGNRDAANAYEDPDAAVHYWAYHQALQRSCDAVTHRFGGGILIDIHGQGANSEVIYRGTRTGQSFRYLLNRYGNDVLIGPDSIIGQMQRRGHSFLPVPTGNSIGTETAYNGGFITENYGSIRQAKVVSLQLELGSSFRSTTAAQNETAADLAAAVSHFYQTYLMPREGAHPTSVPEEGADGESESNQQQD